MVAELGATRPDDPWSATPRGLLGVEELLLLLGLLGHLLQVEARPEDDQHDHTDGQRPDRVVHQAKTLMQPSFTV